MSSTQKTLDKYIYIYLFLILQMFMTASFAPCPGVRMLGDIVGVLVWEKFCSGSPREGTHMPSKKP